MNNINSADFLAAIDSIIFVMWVSCFFFFVLGCVLTFLLIYLFEYKFDSKVLTRARAKNIKLIAFQNISK